jgi:hypothetical protein
VREAYKTYYHNGQRYQQVIVHACTLCGKTRGPANIPTDTYLCTWCREEHRRQPNKPDLLLTLTLAAT